VHSEGFSHADDRENDGSGIAFTQDPGPLTALNVLAEADADGGHDLIPMHDGKLVTLERGVEHEALEARLGAVDFENVRDDEAKQTFVVVAVHKNLQAGKPLFGGSRIAVFEDGAVQILFGGEVAEDDGFGHAGGQGNLAGSGTAEAVLGEEVDGDFEQLPAAFFGGHARMRREGRLSRAGGEGGYSLVRHVLL